MRWLVQQGKNRSFQKRHRAADHPAEYINTEQRAGNENQKDENQPEP
jgi:hypothetical protein